MRTLATIAACESPAEVGRAIIARIGQLAGGAEPDNAIEEDIAYMLTAVNVAEACEQRHQEWTPPSRWDRAIVRAHLEEATGEAMRVDDPLPDHLIAQAQALGLQPVDLSLWIFDGPASRTRSTANLTAWARRHHFGPRCAHCGEACDDPDNHTCRQPTN